MSTARDFPGLRPFKPTPLKVLDPVPSDIDIAQAAELRQGDLLVDWIVFSEQDAELFAVRADVITEALRAGCRTNMLGNHFSEAVEQDRLLHGLGQAGGHAGGTSLAAVELPCL